MIAINKNKSGSDRQDLSECHQLFVGKYGEPAGTRTQDHLIKSRIVAFLTGADGLEKECISH